MMHPDTALRRVSDEIGYGVFATRPIPMGTVVYISDDLEIVLLPDDPRLTHPLYHEAIEKYSYLRPDGARVLSWDLAKYVNHCCHANTLTTGYGFEIAIRDIEAGEEVTDDYGLFSCEPMEGLKCDRAGAHEGEGGCRGRVSRGDFAAQRSGWEAKVRGAMSAFGQVNQPLMSFIDPATLADVHRWLNTGKGYRPIRFGCGAKPLLQNARLVRSETA